MVIQMSESVTVELPAEQYKTLVQIAHSRQMPVQEIAEGVLSAWLDAQRQREDARNLMRKLGDGLGNSGSAENDANINIVRNHDRYLYAKAFPENKISIPNRKAKAIPGQRRSAHG